MIGTVQTVSVTFAKRSLVAAQMECSDIVFILLRACAIGDISTFAQLECTASRLRHGKGAMFCVTKESNKHKEREVLPIYQRRRMIIKEPTKSCTNHTDEQGNNKSSNRESAGIQKSKCDGWYKDNSIPSPQPPFAVCRRNCIEPQGIHSLLYLSVSARACRTPPYNEEPVKQCIRP